MDRIDFDWIEQDLTERRYQETSEENMFWLAGDALS